MNLRLLMIIDSKKDEKKYLKLLNKYKVKLRVITYGKGTASSKILEHLGLNEEEKIIIFSIAPKIITKYILKDITNKLNINEPGEGIAYTIPLSSATKWLDDTYNNLEWKDFYMEENNKELIITITNEGYGENVMTAAKSSGATGGTIINGRGLETEKIIKFLGITVEPEKDIVLILTDEKKKIEIMNSIVEKCGLKTPGAGICFSIPVDNAIGLNE